MQPCLLLALALLGMASASLPGTAEEGHKFRYAVVTKLYNYRSAQRYCREVLGEQLASVHSAACNQELLNLARTYTHCSLRIGALTKCRHGGQWRSQWEDASPWNYSSWAPTHLFATCMTLSTFDGLLRSKFCFQLRPLICQY